MFVYDTHSVGSCFIHVMSDQSMQWLPKQFAIIAMAYPFNQCGYRRISAVISEKNPRSLALAKRFGMVEEGRMRQAAAGGEDYIMLGMLRSECRFLPPPVAL